MFKVGVLVCFLMGSASIALAGDLCEDDPAGGCDAAADIYDAADDTPLVDLVDDDNSGGSSMDEDFSDAAEDQPDSGGGEIVDDDIVD